MYNKHQLLRFIVFLFVLMIGNSFRGWDGDGDLYKGKVTSIIAADALQGAWKLKDPVNDQVLIFVDKYYTHTTYSLSARKFINTKGGTYKTGDNSISVSFEFNSGDKNQVGTRANFHYSIANGVLTSDIGGGQATWVKLDDGTGPLAGNWQITGRMQGDKLSQMTPGARKTIKILSGTRFQWAAINTATAEFSGTGGGVYSFKDGKYTENIEFFSRDSSRVGATLTFDGAVEDGRWIHKGLSSRGEKIHEIWSRPAVVP
jgi:hypothetical protein